ncbi:MAG TPA: hypothetical protein VKA55_00890, partial [Gammaproteobacteria bacterium]|nr:hypothetical protein [Gammaproteobacteria bacterium]
MKRTWTTHRDGPDMPLHGAGAELWSRLEDFAGDAAPSRAVTLRLKRRAALALSAAGVALALVFAGINVLRGLPSTAGWEVAAAVLLAANFHYLVRGGRLARATLAGLIVVVPTLLVGALSVGLPALCWLYALPLVAFFLLGLRAGTVANLV